MQLNKTTTMVFASWLLVVPRHGRSNGSIRLGIRSLVPSYSNCGDCLFCRFLSLGLLWPPLPTPLFDTITNQQATLVVHADKRGHSLCF